MQPTNKSQISVITLKSGKSYLIEYQILADILPLNCFLEYQHQQIISAIAKVLGQNLANSCAIPDKSFIAPYTNFMTTDSTTLIEIITKCRLLPSSSGGVKLIRIEHIIPADLDNAEIEYDKLTHRKYSSLDEYMSAATRNTAAGLDDFAELSTDELARELGLSAGTTTQATRFDVEDWKQCNSEHSRHWFFRTPIPHLSNKSLFDLVKSTLTENPRAQTNSLVAFSDNSSAIKSVIPRAHYLARTANRWQSSDHPGMHPCLTAETHNFPTYYHPFEGANTGIGGRIRDNLAVGTGSLSSGSWAGYSMSDLDMMMSASDGASNYANKVGEPLLGGYLRWHPMFAKPILYTAGVGWIAEDKLLTPETRVQPGDLVIKVGPQAFKIGLGGSLMSSVDNSATGAQDALTAVQRGDPYEGNKVIRFCEYLATQPCVDGQGLIHKIHDQGAGGIGNVVKELVEPYSAEIDLSRLPHAPGMTTLECWLSEYQEQMVFTAPAGNLDELKKLAAREGCGLYVLGHILAHSGQETEPCIHLTGVVGEKYDFHYQRLSHEIPELAERFNPILSGYEGHMVGNRLMLGPDEPNPDGLYMINQMAQTNTLEMKLSNLDPQQDLKLWLTTKIDRSVGGCVIQQPHVGPYGLPMSDYAVLAANPDGSGGWQISAVGENIWVGQTPREFALKCIAELVGNLAGSGIHDLSQVKLSANWMWYIKSPEYCDLMVQCAEALVDNLMALDLAIDGGKDSLSMSIDMPDGERIVSPPSLVLSGYASVPSWTRRATPVLGKEVEDGDFTWLWSLDLMWLLDQWMIGSLSVKDVLGWIFTGVRDGSILAIHDGDTIQDIIEEMCLVSQHGFATEFDLQGESRHTQFKNDPLAKYREHWLVWQSAQEPPRDLLAESHGVRKLGRVLPNSREIYSCAGTWITRCRELFHSRIATTLHQMPILQESTRYLDYRPWEYRWSPEVISRLPTAEQAKEIGSGRRVAIIRDMGSNSHREMAAVFMALGCAEVLDITINDLIDDNGDSGQLMRQKLLVCDGLVFVGGFAYGDVLGSGNATAQVIRSQPELLSIIQQISQDPSKFILGVCNGAQIILALGLFPTPVKLVSNTSKRFESWFLPVEMPDGQQLGIWCAHGEGKFVFPSAPDGAEGKFVFPHDSIGDGIELVGKYTSSEYPANPNGSQLNSIGVRTKYSRKQNNDSLSGWQGADIIALMPHPERSVFKTQCEYIPPELLEATMHTPFTPWIEFFADLFTVGTLL